MGGKMSRIMILGTCPLPFENEKKLYGPGIRTWQFAKPLIDDGHAVCLVCVRIPSAYTKTMPPLLKIEREFTYYHMEAPIFEDTSLIQKIHDEFQPDCVVGATVYPSSRASLLETDKPLWGDLFGHVMAEAQAKAYVYESDHYLLDFWNMEKKVIDRSDKISTVSERQRYATIGELGTRGRLSSRTIWHDFVRVIPCALESTKYKHNMQILKGLVKKKDFIILWSGGYNTWTDVDTLFCALEHVMRKDKNIRFVSIGGQIDGIDEKTYPYFLRLTKGSPFRERFVMCGWVLTEDVPNYYFESNVGINIDKNIYEVMLGSKNRILDWMRMGLPVLTSKVCELSETLEKRNLAITFEAGNPSDLEKKILWCASHRKELKEIGMRARYYAFRHFSYEKTTEPLRKWVKDPKPAPDRGKAIDLYRKSFRELKLLRKYISLMKTEGWVRGSVKSLRWLNNKMLKYKY
jgi:glycosyltransferase involved in cell wall biosynthesis